MVSVAATVSALFLAEAGKARPAPQAKGKQPPRLSGQTGIPSGSL